MTKWYRIALVVGIIFLSCTQFGLSLDQRVLDQAPEDIKELCNELSDPICPKISFNGTDSSPSPTPPASSPPPSATPPSASSPRAPAPSSPATSFLPRSLTAPLPSTTMATATTLLIWVAG